MSIELPTDILESILNSGVLGETDAARMRRAVFEDGAISSVELQTLFEIEELRRKPDAAWSALFCDAIIQHVLEDTPPVGYLSEENARMLIDAIGEKQDARTDTELEALVRIIEKAREVPPFFAAYVLRQLKNTVIYSDGTDARGQALKPGCVSAPELDLIRRVLWGAGSEGHLAVSQDEAEALFDIADATTGNDNDPGWDDLFARAVGNYLIGASGRAVPTRAESLQMWHTEYRSNMLGALGEMFRSADAFVQGFKKAVPAFFNDKTLLEQEEARYAQENAERDAEIANAGILAGPKAEWLLDRIRRNGVTSGPEAVLLAFLQREAGSLPGEIEALTPGPRFATGGR